MADKLTITLWLEVSGAIQLVLTRAESMMIRRLLTEKEKYRIY